MTTFLVVLHVLVCVILIVVVLLQRGKGAEIGAVFGGGASSTVFGSRGAGNFLTRITTSAAIIFMITSLALAYFNAESREGERLFEEGAEEAEAAAPAAEGEAASPFGEFGEFGEAPPAAEAAPEAPPAPETAPQAEPAGEAPAQPAAP
jgi:preprotein translocase subunit SecG